MAIYTKGSFEKWVNIYIENPLKIWWKVRKYFKRPKISIHFFSSPVYNCPYASFKWIGKILDIKSTDIMWKPKYDSYRFERPPYIWVCFFKRFGFSINFTTYYKNEFGEKELFDDYYWEYILDHLLGKLPLTSASKTWITSSKIYKKYNYDKEKFETLDIPIPIVQYALTKEGIKHLKMELKENESNRKNKEQ